MYPMLPIIEDTVMFLSIRPTYIGQVWLENTWKINVTSEVPIPGPSKIVHFTIA